MFVEIVNDHTNEQVESEKGSEDDEKDKVKVHVNVDLTDRLLAQLQEKYILKIYLKKRDQKPTFSLKRIEFFNQA